VQVRAARDAEILELALDILPTRCKISSSEHRLSESQTTLSASSDALRIASRREEEAMLMRTDPLRDLDRLTEAVLGTRARPAMMPMDAYREDGTFVVHLDVPGVSVDSIDLTVEKNVLTVHAERKPPLADGAERVIDERSYGVFSRQLFLGDTLDTDHLSATYDDGVLTLTIPIAEKAKPRKVEITGGETTRQEIDA